MKFSILYCVNGNPTGFANSLWTACRQRGVEPYEIIVIDNATDGEEVRSTAASFYNFDSANSDIKYARINYPRCPNNISQAINIAAEKAQGQYIVILSDSNLLISFNVLMKITLAINKNTLVLSSGPDNDIQLLTDKIEKLGFPCDPYDMDLPDESFKNLPSHMMRGAFISAIHTESFIMYGGYDETSTEDDMYHESFMNGMASFMRYECHLTDVRAIRQYNLNS